VLTVNRRSFARDEIAFLENVAGELAISVENARMHTVTDAQLRRKIERLHSAGYLGETSLEDATVAFEAVMEGLANAELRGGTLPILPAGDEERAWRSALETVIRGFGAPAHNLFRRGSRAEHGGVGSRKDRP